MDDKVLALCELSNDLLYEKIPKEKRLYYVEESLKAGFLQAEQYSGQDMETLYENNGIHIHYCKESKAALGVILRGQMVLGKGEATVELYRSSIEALANQSSLDGTPALSYEQAKNLHLAHEFFHYLEHTKLGFISEMLEPVVLQHFWGWERKAQINRCSEIAAHAFAKNMLQLPYLPNYYDYAYLIHQKQMTRESFEQMLETNRQGLL